MKARILLIGGYLWSERSGETIRPLGYCAVYSVPLFEEEAARIPFAAKHHADAHPTPESALACYREHQLDQHLDLNYDLGFETACTEPHDEPTPTTKAAEIEGWRLALCEEHRTPEIAALRYPGPWESDD